MSVFISYRRDGGKPVAEEIYRVLSAEYDIFLDTESLKNGYFDSAILKRIKSCSDFILIVTETVFDRCSEPNDWIMNEVSSALSEKKNIIPVFVGINGFPENVPESLKEICRYNGIFWAEPDETFKKLRSFLISNRQYTLSVERSGDSIVLSPESRDELKALYIHFLKTKNRKVDIKIDVQDTEELVPLLIRRDIADEHGIETAQNFARQTLLSRINRVKRSVETAVEYLLGDTLADSFSVNFQQAYAKKYGYANSTFTDENGLLIFYWTPFLWIDIIEELLKEFSEDRLNAQSRSRDFTSIDCFILNKQGAEVWSFFSRLPSRFDDRAQTKIHELIVPGFPIGFADLPKQAAVSNILPDFYYSIGRLKVHDRKRFEDIMRFEGVLDITKYRFGLS